MCSNKSENILANDEWAFYYVRVPAIHLNEEWEIIDTVGVRKVRMRGKDFYIPRNGAAFMKIRKKVDVVKMVDGVTPLKLGEDYVEYVIMFGDFGIRLLSVDEDGLENTTPKDLLCPDVPGEVRWVVIENLENVPDYVNIMTETFVIDEGDMKVKISPDGFEV